MFAYSPAAQEGSGYAVITDRFVCLLGPDATSEIARSVFWLLDGEDAQLDDALGTLTHVEAVERFALVEVLDPVTRSMYVAALGDVGVRIHGTTSSRASSTAEGTWITTEARGVNALRMALDGAGIDGELLPVRRGVVRTNAIVVEPVADYPFTSAEEESIIPEPLEVGPVVHDLGFELQSDDHEQEELAELELTVQPTDGPRWVLRLPDGHEFEANGTIVIGRTSGSDDGVHHVEVPSPQRQISASHLEVALVDGELVARDLDSTNGTIVLTPQQPPRLLHRGDTTSLQAGDILDLGESFQIVVSNRT